MLLENGCIQARSGIRSIYRIMQNGGEKHIAYPLDIVDVVITIDRRILQLYFRMFEDYKGNKISLPKGIDRNFYDDVWTNC